MPDMPAEGTVATRNAATREEFHLRGWRLVGQWQGQDVWRFPEEHAPLWMRIAWWIDGLRQR